ncbi:MAG: glycoside hydrolase family 3 C-terminal domain-containing protein [Lachnospiraceae bacterium]|nr:glycoside hydrolase family 3 C-terminal domain-containing protein [Lachnospiraceae bacterium]
MKTFEKEIDAIISELTLEEKVNMLHGFEFFRSGGVEEKGIPCLVSSDGPMGVRNQFPGDSWFPINLSDDFVSYLPSNSAVSATWNPECAYKGGQVLGEEARGRGKDVILAPGINIKRDPLCGRNFEYMSEDPYLVEEMTVPMIKGIQESDVAACVKHFAVNSQETNRLWVDTIVDERTLREIYLPGFKAAVQKAGTYSLMNAYNMFEGVHCSANKRLLDEILRKEWGYDGTVISDWGSVHSTKETAEASMDLEMSVTTNFDEYFFAKPLVDAVEKGEVKIEDVDAKVRNILRMMYRLKMIGPEALNRKAGAYNTREHQMAIRETARESMVLLKNDEQKLPITKERWTMSAGKLAPKKKRIAVIGRNAEFQHAGGGGSAEIKALYEISPLMGIKTYLGGNADVVYAAGYFIPGKKEDVNEANWQETSLERQISRRDFMGETEEQQRQREEVMTARKQLLEEAVELAKTADEVIFVGGLNHDYDVEGWDRDNMKLPYAQDELIEALLEVRPDTTIVIVAGSPVEMPWRDKAKAILWCYYAGMETGHALAEVLFGEVNPSGKLPESFPVKYEDTVTFKNGEFGKEDSVTYKEGIFYGYRYYEKEGIQPAFAFGHGLSYTTFAYDNLRVEALEGAGVVEKEADLELAAVKVLVDITNNGNMAGAEVVQCYVSDLECSVERPVKELKAFGKVFLEPGETKTVEMFINNRGFAFYDVEKKAFVVEAGEFELHVGGASDKIYQSAKICLTK